jgi:hypothetical protein
MTPAVIVNTLSGIGEKPATNTAQNPHWSSHSLASSYAGQ